MGTFTRKLFLAFLLANVTLAALIHAMPRARPHDIELEMRQIPQTHCLRFRKFDLIKRCRRYRIRRHR